MLGRVLAVLLLGSVSVCPTFPPGLHGLRLRGGRDCFDSCGLWLCLRPEPRWRDANCSHDAVDPAPDTATGGRESMPAVCCNRVLAGKGLGLAHGDSGAADESAPGCRLCQMTLAELDRSLLTAAAEEGLGPEIEALVEHGADVNAINAVPSGRLIFPLDGFGWSPMHYAAARGDSACVRLLWQLGAEAVQTTPVHEWTPLHLAAAHGHGETIELLLDMGCFVDARTTGEPGVKLGATEHLGWGGATPLHLAAAMGQEVFCSSLQFMHTSHCIAYACMLLCRGTCALITPLLRRVWSEKTRPPLQPRQLLLT